MFVTLEIQQARYSESSDRICDQHWLSKATEEHGSDEDLPTDGREQRVFGTSDWKLGVCGGFGVRKPNIAIQIVRAGVSRHGDWVIGWITNMVFKLVIFGKDKEGNIWVNDQDFRYREKDHPEVNTEFGVW